MHKFIAVLLFFSLSSLQAATYDVGKSKNEVNFVAVGHPSALRIKGAAKEDGAVTGKLKVDAKALSGTIQLKLASLNTGIEMRDEHMKEKYLEVKKFPSADLMLSNLALGSKETPFNGTLKLHGVSHAVSGKATSELDGKSLNLSLEFTLLLKDHAIEIPNYLGIKVANDVKVSASTEGKVE